MAGSRILRDVLPTVAPMLASSSPLPQGANGEWRYEPKLDGWRVLVYVDGVLDVRTRTGRSITASVPELDALRAALRGNRVVLDGELVAGQGRPDDFYALAPRLSASSPRSVMRWSARVPLTLAVFDLLYLDGGDLRSATYLDRRAALASLALSGPRWCTVASYDGDGTELLASCGELDLEGVVAKRCAAPYRSRTRSRDWIKVKTPMWREDHGPRRHEAAADINSPVREGLASRRDRRSGSMGTARAGGGGTGPSLPPSTPLRPEDSGPPGMNVGRSRDPRACRVRVAVRGRWVQA
jgi:ATP-dependent DNA ligase